MTWFDVQVRLIFPTSAPFLTLPKKQVLKGVGFLLRLFLKITTKS